MKMKENKSFRTIKGLRAQAKKDTCCRTADMQK
jgi:hypothetical protein